MKVPAGWNNFLNASSNKSCKYAFLSKQWEVGFMMLVWIHKDQAFAYTWRTSMSSHVLTNKHVGWKRNTEDPGILTECWDFTDRFTRDWLKKRMFSFTLCRKPWQFRLWAADTIIEVSLAWHASECSVLLCCNLTIVFVRYAGTLGSDVFNGQQFLQQQAQQHQSLHTGNCHCQNWLSAQTSRPEPNLVSQLQVAIFSVDRCWPTTVPELRQSLPEEWNHHFNNVENRYHNNQ